MVTAQTDGFFAVREAQCNITFYPTTLPDRDSLNAALTSALGAGPGNAAEAVKRTASRTRITSRDGQSRGHLHRPGP